MNTEQKANLAQTETHLREELQSKSAAPHITLFVYGTLKSGQANHARFCANAIRIESAATIGRLYALPAGYPALEVPEEHILMGGTANPLADAAALTSITARTDLSGSMPQPAGDWDMVYGELITLAEPLHSLPPIDRLEGFHPGGGALYQRVLLPVLADGATRLAWVYIMKKCANRNRLREGVWH